MKHRTKIICIFLLFLFNSVNASDYYTVMKTNTLDIRSGPGENYSIVGTLSLGDTVLIDKIVTPWCQIIENNKTKGYANGWYLTKVETSVNSNKSSNNFLFYVVIAVVLIIIIVVAISSSKKKVQPPISTDNSTNTNDSKNQVKDRPRVIVTKSTKSVGLAIFLSIIFPYFGVLYSTVSGFFWLFFS